VTGGSNTFFFFVHANELVLILPTALNVSMSDNASGTGAGPASTSLAPTSDSSELHEKKRSSELALEEEQLPNKRHETLANVTVAKADNSESKTDQVKAVVELSTGNFNVDNGGTDTNKKKESSSRDVNDTDAKPFGGRILTDESAVFEQNAWDHAPWGEEQEQHALKEIARQKLDPVPNELVETYHAEAAENWNKFYAKNENRFYKDRHYLRVEFPELFQMVEADVSPNILCHPWREPTGRGYDLTRHAVYFDPFQAGEKAVMEIGCGAGNTMFPLLRESKNPKLFVYACDFSSTAVEVVKSNPVYDAKRGKAFVWDLAGDDIPPEVEPESMDVLVLIFVLSALHPDKWEQAMNNLYKVRDDLPRIRGQSLRCCAYITPCYIVIFHYHVAP